LTAVTLQGFDVITDDHSTTHAGTDDESLLALLLAFDKPSEAADGCLMLDTELFLPLWL